MLAALLSKNAAWLFSTLPFLHASSGIAILSFFVSLLAPPQRAQHKVILSFQ
jgi:hypothetical protein